MSIDLGEKLRTASDLFREEAGVLVEKGARYYDDAIFDTAVSALQRVVPEIAALAHSRVGVESGRVVSIDTRDHSSISFGGVVVEATLKGIILQELREEADFDGVALDRDVIDLCAVLLPRYVDPNPVDVVLRDELYVPLSGIRSLESVAGE